MRKGQGGNEERSGQEGDSDRPKRDREKSRRDCGGGDKEIREKGMGRD